MLKQTGEKKKRKSKSLYLIVLRSYILFIVVGIVLLLNFYKMASELAYQSYNPPELSEFVDKLAKTAESDYGKLPVRKYMGRKGYVEILDADGKSIYVSDKSKSRNYTHDMLALIPDIQLGTSYYIDKIHNKDGQIGYYLVKYATLEEDESSVMQPAGIVILDNERNVVYSTGISLEKKRLTKDEITFLVNYGADFLLLQKMQFTDKNGTVRYCIAHVDYQTWYNGGQQGVKIMFTFFASAAAILFALTSFFTLLIMKHVTSPLKVIKEAMNRMKSPDASEHISSYEGPLEFEEIIKSFNDMSERLAKSEKHRIQMEEERRDMLMDISHDLRTPITVIEGYARAVNDGVVKSDDAKKYLSTIVTKAEMLSELINQFYEFSRIEHPQYDLKMEKGDLCEYLREYLAEKYEELDLLGFELITDIPDEVIMASFDRMQLKRVFENIISNTIRHNSEGIQIYAGVKTDGFSCIIQLGDNGIGIPESMRDRIFEPFVVGEKARTSGKGSGLGMAIAKRIVEAHGGTITLGGSEEEMWHTMYEIVIPVESL